MIEYLKVALLILTEIISAVARAFVFILFNPGLELAFALTLVCLFTAFDETLPVNVNAASLLGLLASTAFWVWKYQTRNEALKFWEIF